MADHARSKMKRVVIVPDTDRVKAAELVELLKRSNIEVKVAGAPFNSSTAHAVAFRSSLRNSRVARL